MPNGTPRPPPQTLVPSRRRGHPNLQKVPLEWTAEGIPNAAGFTFEKAADGRVRITPPAGTMSLGLTTAAPPPATATLLLQGDATEHAIPIPTGASGADAFLGIVAYRPIAGITVPGPVRSLSIERLISGSMYSI